MFLNEIRHQVAVDSVSVANREQMVVNVFAEVRTSDERVLIHGLLRVFPVETSAGLADITKRQRFLADFIWFCREKRRFLAIFAGKLRETEGVAAVRRCFFMRNPGKSLIF